MAVTALHRGSASGAVATCVPLRPPLRLCRRAVRADGAACQPRPARSTSHWFRQRWVYLPRRSRGGGTCVTRSLPTRNTCREMRRVEPGALAGERPLGSGEPGASSSPVAGVRPANKATRIGPGGAAHECALKGSAGRGLPATLPLDPIAEHEVLREREREYLPPTFLEPPRRAGLQRSNPAGR